MNSLSGYWHSDACLLGGLDQSPRLPEVSTEFWWKLLVVLLGQVYSVPSLQDGSRSPASHASQREELSDMSYQDGNVPQEGGIMEHYKCTP